MSLFKEYSTIYLEFKKHEIKFSSYDKYFNIIENRINPIFGDMNIQEVKPSDVKRWLYSITDVGGKSLRTYLSVLGGIFQEALYDEVILRNPVKVVRLPKFSKPVIIPFTSDEVEKIMAAAPDHNYKYYIAIAFYTGMRSGEIIGLKKSDIDLEKSTIKIERTRSRFGESTPKTKTSLRTIPILEILRPFIIELLELHDNEYLFVTQYNEPYLDTHTFVESFWKPSLKELGIDYRRPYNTRHTYATNMLYRNLVTPIQLAQLLGHASTEMVFNVYVKFIDSEINDFDKSISIYN
ncbi:MAG: site-specific integrase [SAR324 cluster bacterium]|uniref:Site-specific integrase n=1 Tax=SAR324 cluster bacterium TaxID=2024889 RepID=A0A2A4T278_9DELT|nr:MAG: site-specific integrase [SAR324 cluster bacterium]